MLTQLRVFCRPLVAQRSAVATHTHTENTLTSGWTCAQSTPVSAVFSLGFDFLVRHLQKSKPKKTTEQQSGGHRVQRDDTSCWNFRLKLTGNKADHFLFAFLPCCLCIYRPAAVVALNVIATQLVEGTPTPRGRCAWSPLSARCYFWTKTRQNGHSL